MKRRHEKESKEQAREELLHEARCRAEPASTEEKDPDDGYRGEPGQACLLYDMRGEPAQLKWLGDLSRRVADGISRFCRPCGHGVYAGYLTRLDIRGHKVSKDGVLAIAQALGGNQQLATLRADGKVIDFDVSKKDAPFWRLYDPDLCRSEVLPGRPGGTTDSMLDANRLQFLSRQSRYKVT